jgi:hypothetical protein
MCDLTYHSTDDGDSIGQQMTSRNLVEASQVSKAGSTDLASVRSLGTVRDDKDTHLTLGGLDGRVGLTRRNGVTLAVKQEMVNESLHVLLHGSTRRRGDLVVLDLDGSRGDLVQALEDDAQRLAELLHTAEVTVVAVTVDTNGHVELDLVVSIVRLGLADVPWDTRATKHDTSERVVESVSGGNNTNTLGTALPDTVVGQKLLGLVNAVTELGGPLVDIIQDTNGKILRNTTGTDVSSVETGTRYTLVELLWRIVSNCTASN